MGNGMISDMKYNAPPVLPVFWCARCERSFLLDYDDDKTPAWGLLKEHVNWWPGEHPRG